MNDPDPLVSKRSKRKSQDVDEVPVKRVHRSRSSSSDNGKQTSFQHLDKSAKLHPLKSDNHNRSRLPVPIRSHSSSDSAEDVPNNRTNPSIKKPSPSKPPKIPEVEVTAPRESVRTPVEGDALSIDFHDVSLKDKDVEQTPRKTELNETYTEHNSAQKLKSRRSSKERRKSKRRSSFVVGRITRQAPALSSSELCESIPLDLSDAERLAKLSHLALEYTIDKLHSEFEDVHGFQQLATKCKCGVEEKLEGMTDLFSQATTLSRIVPNPVNERRSAEITQLRADRAQLQQEIAEWDNIVRHHHQLAEQATQQYQNLSSHPITLDSCSLSSRQKSILAGRPDLQGMLTDLAHMKETTVLALDAISEKVRVLTAVSDIADKTIQQHSQILASKSFPQQQKVDPRTLIENCLSL